LMFAVNRQPSQLSGAVKAALSFQHRISRTSGALPGP
jgi:hypothetical protein